jgi:REP element-mobilizing transposase RayT
MPRGDRKDIPKTIHHVIQRGNNRNYIYENTRDKQEFLSILRDALQKYKADLLQYVLMDNHYHLLVQIGDQPLAQLLWYLNRHYTIYYNKRYNRIGTIYGGRYKSYLMTERAKLYSTIRYIVRNPVKAGMVSHASDYRWSGHRAVISSKGPMLINRDALLSCFAPDRQVALQRCQECTESEGWLAPVGSAVIIDRTKETEERLACLLDSYLDACDALQYRKMIICGSRSSVIRPYRDTFICQAIRDGHTLNDIAQFLHVSHETIRRIGQTERCND